MADPVYFRVEPDASGAFVRVVRTPAPMPERRDDIIAAFSALLTPLKPYLGGRVLLDLRLGPGRNDPEFEEATRELRTSILGRFARVAVLVRSAAGKLHVRRLSDGEGEVYLDEGAAVRFLSQKQT